MVEQFAIEGVRQALLGYIQETAAYFEGRVSTLRHLQDAVGSLPRNHSLLREIANAWEASEQRATPGQEDCLADALDDLLANDEAIGGGPGVDAEAFCAELVRALEDSANGPARRF